MKTGRFVSFEGGEGSGKSTQIRLLAERLRAREREVIATREPGGTPSAEAIRDLLVSGDTERWDATSEMLLNYAAREDHLARVIRPALETGKWVLCDRFADSTRAYQGSAGGADPELLAQLEASVIADTWPDLTFILDIDPEQGLDRAGARGDDTSRGERRFENKELSFHRTLRTAFLDIAASEPGRCVVVDAGGSTEEIGEQVWREVVSRLKP